MQTPPSLMKQRPAGRALVPLLALLACAAAASAQLPDAINLHMGEQRTVTGYRADRISMGRSGIVDVSVLPNNSLLFTALTVGETEISLWDARGAQTTVKVAVSPDFHRMARALETLLRQVENATVQIVGDKIVIDGKLLTKSDSDRVAAIVQAYGDGSIVNLTTLDRGPGNTLVGQFIRERSGVDSIEVNILGDTAYLSGYVLNPAAKSNVLAIARTQVDKMVDLIEVRDVLISTEILFLKVSKLDSYDVGVNLLQTMDTTLDFSGNRSRVNREWSPLDVTVDWTANLIPKLNILFGNGDAQILARPHITTKSGEKGNFQSGGEYYYEVTGVQVAGLQSIQYGLTLQVQPRLNLRNEIISDLTIEIKVPVAASGNQQLSLETFSSQNIVTCKLGQSIILSGLVQNLRNRMRSRTPILGDIPILGFFFGNRTKMEQDSELVAIVTPRIISLEQQAGSDSLEQARQQVDTIMNRLHTLLEDNP